MSACPDKPYILWLDYGTEGWQPNGFDTLEAVTAAIQNGSTYGNGFVVTRAPLVLQLQPDARYE